MGVSQNWGTILGVPIIRIKHIFGVYIGVPLFWEITIIWRIYNYPEQWAFLNRLPLGLTKLAFGCKTCKSTCLLSFGVQSL